MSEANDTKLAAPPADKPKIPVIKRVKLNDHLYNGEFRCISTHGDEY